MPSMGTRRRKEHARPARAALPSESRAAEALTIGWLLAVLTAGLCELGGALALALRELGPGIELAGHYLFFVALVMGATSLILAAGVFKSRRVPPPRGITVVGLVVGAAPFVVLLLQIWR